jgi:hypothetical protein
VKVRGVLLLGLLLAGCAGPVPTGSLEPVSTPSAAATSTPSPSPSPAPTPTPTALVTCLPDTGYPAPADLPSALSADACPLAIAAVETLVAPLGYPVSRIYLAPDPFFCGDLWPDVSTPYVCSGPAVLPGLTRHGWVAFAGTPKVAAVSLVRGEPTNESGQPEPWTATLVAFVVPPVGWGWP